MPNVVKMKSYGALQFLIHKNYQERSLSKIVIKDIEDIKVILISFIISRQRFLAGNGKRYGATATGGL